VWRRLLNCAKRLEVRQSSGALGWLWRGAAGTEAKAQRSTTKMGGREAGGMESQRAKQS